MPWGSKPEAAELLAKHGVPAEEVDTMEPATLRFARGGGGRVSVASRYKHRRSFSLDLAEQRCDFGLKRIILVAP